MDQLISSRRVDLPPPSLPPRCFPCDILHFLGTSSRIKVPTRKPRTAAFSDRAFLRFRKASSHLHDTGLHGSPNDTSWLSFCPASLFSLRQCTLFRLRGEKFTRASLAKPLFPTERSCVSEKQALTSTTPAYMEAEMILRGSIDLFEVSRSTTAASMEVEVLLRGSINLVEVSRSTSSFSSAASGFSSHFTAEGWCPFKNRHSATSMDVEVLLRGSIDLVEVRRSTSSFSSVASGFSSHFHTEGWCPFRNRHSAASMEVEVLLRGSIDFVEVSRSTSNFCSAASSFSYHFNPEGWCPFKNRNSAASPRKSIYLLRIFRRAVFERISSTQRSW